MSALSDQTTDPASDKRAAKLRSFAYLCFGVAVFAALPMWYYFGELAVTKFFNPTPRTIDKISLAAGIVIAAALIKLAQLRPRLFVGIFATMNMLFLLLVGGDIWLRFFRIGPPLIAAAFLLTSVGLYLQLRSNSSSGR